MNSLIIEDDTGVKQENSFNTGNVSTGVQAN